MTISRTILEQVGGRALGAVGDELAAAMNHHFATYGIVTKLRQAHFLAQACHETGGFKRFVEMGNGDKNGDGLDDYLIRYDTRTDLGNTPQIDGDGQKYRGRGIFQLTGKANYERYGKKLGVDLVNNPEQAAKPDLSVKIACLYWTDNGLNSLADADNARTITRRINGGYNGLDDRLDRLRRAKKALGV